MAGPSAAMLSMAALLALAGPSDALKQHSKNPTLFRPSEPRHVELDWLPAKSPGLPVMPASHFHPHDKAGKSRWSIKDSEKTSIKDSEKPSASNFFRFSAHRMDTSDQAHTQTRARTQAQSYSVSGAGQVPAKDANTADTEPENLSTTPANANSSPYERFGASSVIRGNTLYVFGGMAKGSDMPSNQLLEFDLDGRIWSPVDVYGTAPPGRLFHSATLSEDGSVMFITGGTPCFSRVFQKSLSFDDANGQYVPMLQHATTETTSIEHSQGFDDVYSYRFDTKEWSQLKASSVARQDDCKAATNVYYNAASASVSSSLVLLSVATMAVVLSTSGVLF